MTYQAREIPSGTRGFDCNLPLSYEQYRKFYDKKYRFVARYLPRIRPGSNDLSEVEVETAMKAGVGLMGVQHVEPGLWTPTSAKGKDYGIEAARYARDCGLVIGTSIWLDLESVADGVTSSNVILYANNWFDQVEKFGYEAGLYVGWKSGLNGIQLYKNLRFKHYWGAYNLDKDLYPITRSLQMKQCSVIDSDRPENITFGFDTDIVIADLLGGLPFAQVPEEWDIG